jgi:folate-dependent phosphoribosylglycinamide formyltransferase PurN
MTDTVLDERRGACRAFTIPDCSSPGDLRFAYLNLESHPRGELMLERLIAAGFVPDLVIDEKSQLARTGRDSQLKKLCKFPGFSPSTSTVSHCVKHEIRYVSVDNHNDAATRMVLREMDLHVAVLGDTRILRSHVIDSLPHGIINVHPGFLPKVRGNNPYVWSIIHNLPQGATAHLINDGVDRGPILVAREMPLPADCTIPELVHLVNELCADLAVESLGQLVKGEATLTEQPCDDGVTFREARPEIWSLAEKILREKAARHSGRPYLR